MRSLRRYQAWLLPVVMLAMVSLVASGSLLAAELPGHGDAAALADAGHGGIAHAEGVPERHDHAGADAGAEDCSPIGVGCAAPFPAPALQSALPVRPAPLRAALPRAPVRLSRLPGFDPPPPRSLTKIA